MRRVIAAVFASGVAAACADTPQGDDRPPFDWTLDLEELDDALLSVWVGDPVDALVVGGTAGRGLVLEWNGSRWDRAVLPDDTSILWWVWALPRGDAFAAGEGATVLRRAGSVWRREVDVGVSADRTFYGVWGTSDEDVWAVGGTLAPVADAGVLAHWDGLAWTTTVAPRLVFKVWGAASDDVWAVGVGGLLLHFDGETWTESPSPTTDNLIAVYGRGGDDVFAVGGTTTGVAIHWDGVEWELYTERNEALSGVWTAPGRPVYVSGARGYLGRFDMDPDETVALPTVDFHAVAGAEDVILAVGADLQSAGAGGWHGALASHGRSFAGPVVLAPDASTWNPPDAGPPDAPPAAGAGEGELCGTEDVGYRTCRGDLTCWLLFADTKWICTAHCDTITDCGAYGAEACCDRPGFQTLETVCIPKGYSACP